MVSAVCRGARPLGLALTLAVACAARAAQPADLTALSFEQLLDVKVVGASKYEQRQSEVAASVSVITRLDIQTFGWRTLDEALASLPGVHATYDRQYNYLGTRGFSLPGDFNTRVLVTIDGNRTNDPTYDGAPFGTQFPLDMDLVERIEFIPGPGSSVYGQNAMFGVVNVVTRSGAGVGGAELAAAYQRPQGQRQGRASWGKALDNGVDVLLSMSGLRAAGADRRMDFGSAGVTGTAAGLDGERDHEFFARVGLGSWSFEHVYGKHRKDDPTGVYFSDPLVPGQYQGDLYSLTQLHYQHGAADSDLQVSARLFAGTERYSSTLRYGTEFHFPARSDWRGVDLRALSNALAGHKLMVGLEAQQNTRVDQDIQDLAQPANNLRIRSPGHRVGVYVQDEWRLADSLTATAGLRVDRNAYGGQTLSPRAALIWQAGAATTVKALYGRAHRAPNAYERDYDDGFAQVGNAALKDETIETLELVVDHRVDRQFALRASVYRWTMNDVVTLGIEPASGMPQYRSGARVDSHGFELSADRGWDSGLHLRGSVSLQDATDAGGAVLLNSPKVLGKLNLSTPLPAAGLRLGYEWRYDGKRRTLDGSDTGGHAVSNLYLGTQALARGLEVSVGVANLLDKRYVHPASDSNWQNAFEQDGRSVRVKLVYQY